MAGIKQLLSRSEAGIIITAAVLAMIFGSVNPTFLAWGNLTILLRAMAYPGIVAVGLAICLISGTIDLSVGAMAGLSGIIFSQSMVALGLSIPVSAALAIVAGFVVGIINSIVIIYFHVTPFIATIAMMYVLRGLGSVLSKGFTIFPLPQAVADFGAARPLGISWSFVILVVILLIAAWAVGCTVWGLCLRATGSDIESARDTEVNVISVQVSALVIAAVLASISGILVTAVLDSGVPSTGTGWELAAIAACVIGGISMSGYEGSFIGLFFGLLVMQEIQNGIIIIGMSPYWQSAIIGVILLAAMAVDVRRRRYLNLEKL